MPYEIIRGPVEAYSGSRKKTASPSAPPATNEKFAYSKSHKKKYNIQNGDFNNSLHPVYLSEKGFMDDVLNLKIYKLPTSLTTTFLKPNGQKVLLGENIINSVTTSQLVSSKKSRTSIVKEKETNNEENKNEMTEKIDFRNSLLYKFLLSKKKIKDYRSDALVDDDVVCIDRIKNSNNRANQFKAGRDLTSELQYRTLQETLDWAVDYVRLNETQLAKDLQILVDEMKAFMDKRKIKSRMSNASTPNIDIRNRDGGDTRNSTNKSDSDNETNDIQPSQQPATTTTTTAPTNAVTTTIPHQPVTPSGHIPIRKSAIKKTDGNVPKLSLAEKLKRIERLSSRRNVTSAGGGGTMSREGKSPKYGMSANDAGYRDEDDDFNEDHFGDINTAVVQTPSPALGEPFVSGTESPRRIDSRSNLHSNNSNRMSTRIASPREPHTPSNLNSLRKQVSPSDEKNSSGIMPIKKQMSGLDNPHKRKFRKPSLKIDLKKTTNSDNEENESESRQSRTVFTEIAKCPSESISPKIGISPNNTYSRMSMRATTAPSSPAPGASPSLPGTATGRPSTSLPPIHYPTSPPRTERRPTTTSAITRPTPISHTPSNDNDLTSSTGNHHNIRNYSTKQDGTVVQSSTPVSILKEVPTASATRSPRNSARGIRGELVGGIGTSNNNNNNNNNSNTDVLAETLHHTKDDAFTPKTPSSPRAVRMQLPVTRRFSLERPQLRKRRSANESIRYSSNSNTAEFLRKSAVLQFSSEKSKLDEKNISKIIIRKENSYFEEMGNAISELKNKQNKVNTDGSRMLKRIDQFFESQIINANKTRSVFDTKEYHRPELLKEKFDKWLLLEYESSKHSHLELDAKKDMQLLEDHVQRKHYRQSMENLVKSSWFVPCFTKLQEVAQRNGQPIPKSCLKFLSVLQCIFMVGREFTPDLFYYVMEHTVAKEDHILLGVYKTLRYALDAVNITPDSFLDYLEERGIQPCAEHLANIRKLRKLGRLKLAAAGRNNTNVESTNVSPTGSGPGSRIRFNNDIEQPRPRSKRASNLELIFEDDEPYDESGESSRLSEDAEAEAEREEEEEDIEESLFDI